MPRTPNSPTVPDPGQRKRGRGSLSGESATRRVDMRYDGSPWTLVADRIQSFVFAALAGLLSGFADGFLPSLEDAGLAVAESPPLAAGAGVESFLAPSL